MKLVIALLPRAFEWARAAHPTQPLTSGVWKDDWSSSEKLGPGAKIQIAMSDVISFQPATDKPEVFEKRVLSLATVSPAALCTEYMARGKREYFPGDASDRQEVQRGGNQLGTGGGEDPNVFALGLVAAPVYGSRAGDWFHEIFRTDGTPYNADETAFIKQDDRTRLSYSGTLERKISGCGDWDYGRAFLLGKRDAIAEGDQPARIAATRSPGTRIPTKLRGSAAETVTISPEGCCLRMARSDSTATGSANCSPRKPLMKRPPRISPRSSRRGARSETSTPLGQDRFADWSTSRKHDSVTAEKHAADGLESDIAIGAFTRIKQRPAAGAVAGRAERPLP